MSTLSVGQTLRFGGIKLFLVFLLILFIGSFFFVYKYWGKIPLLKQENSKAAQFDVSILSFDTEASKQLFIKNQDSLTRETEPNKIFGILYSNFNTLKVSYAVTRDHDDLVAARNLLDLFNTTYKEQSASRSAELVVTCLDSSCRTDRVPSEITDLQNKIKEANISDKDLERSLVNTLDIYSLRGRDEEKVDVLNTAYSMIASAAPSEGNGQLKLIASEVEQFVKVNHPSGYKIYEEAGFYKFK